MVDVAAVLRELDLLEQVQRELAAIASRIDDARRKDLIEGRRRLSDQIARIGAVAEPHFADDPAVHRQYRALYSAMRAAAALHQASWPAVMLGERHDDYSASAQRVRQANREFVTWMRTALATRDGKR